MHGGEGAPEAVRRGVVSRTVRSPTLWVIVVGLVTTIGFAWATWRAHDDNEDRITRRRTREAASVLEAAVPSIELPLATTAALDQIAMQGDPAVFERALATQVGQAARFVSGSLWPASGGAPVAVLGERPKLATLPSPEVAHFFERVSSTDGLNVLGLLDGDEPRLGYAYTPPGAQPAFVVYVESALPTDRTTVVQPDNAFSGMDYALYLGDDEAPGSLLVASTSDLPITGRRAESTVTLGDTDLLMVMTPTEELGGPLLARLPWLVLATGLALTAAGTVFIVDLLRRRAQAEQLARENEHLYAQQRRASEALQRSLLPDELPEVPGMEIAVAYATGVSGTEVGGDWYDVVLQGDRLVVVVGDVSGRGLAAASVMAALRFGMRLPAGNGDPPDTILTKMDRVGTVEVRGHFATVLCAALQLDGRTMAVANAGHPPPLLVDGGAARWLETPVGPPLGALGGASYAAATLDLPAAGTLLLVTDGLFERRGEPLDVGLERVRAAAEALVSRPLTALVDDLMAELTSGTAVDDAAVLALRWGT